MYVSSAQSFNDFVDGSIWKDIHDELNKWLDDIHESLEDPEDVLDDKQHAKLRGNAEAVRKFMLLPYMVRENILEDARREEESGEIEKETDITEGE